MFFSTQNDVIIYIEEKVSSLAARLLEVAVPEKEVPFEQLIKPRRDLSGAEENKPVVAIGNMNGRKDFEPVYDTGAEADISDEVLLILRNLYIPKSGGKDSTRKLPEQKKELLEIAGKTLSRLLQKGSASALTSRTRSQGKRFLKNIGLIR